MSILTTLTNIILHIAQKTDAKNFAVYQKSGEENTEVLTSVKFMDASIEDDVQLMEHPKEDGTLITDHEVQNPNRITLRAVISDDDSEVLAEIQDFYKNATTLIVKAKGELYPNVVISAKPFKLDSTYFTKTVYDITFREIQVAQTQYVKMKVSQVRNKKNASTQKTGQKQAKQTVKKQSLAKKIGL